MEELGGANKQVIQRLGLALVLAVVFYVLSLGSGMGGTFQSESKPAKANSAFNEDADSAEDAGWGNGTRGAGSRDRLAEARRQREGSSPRDIPTYDPGKDGGWGSN